MAKIKLPLLSLNARKTIGNFLTFKRSRSGTIAESKPVPFDPNTVQQQSWRHMFLKVVALWNALTPAEQQDWESLARRHHLTGYQWFVSQALRPNPGIYLPLQGGTMSGDIDMAKFRMLKLPAPADPQEALRLSEYTANIAPYLYNEGARAYHNANQAIPNATWTAVALNSEDYDTDTIHDLVANNSRLTCKTAGIYTIVFHARLASNATGLRGCYIRQNGPLDLVYQFDHADTSTIHSLHRSTQWRLAVNEYVEALLYQNSGAPLNLLAYGNSSPIFSMQRIGV